MKGSVVVGFFHSTLRYVFIFFIPALIPVLGTWQVCKTLCIYLLYWSISLLARLYYDSFSWNRKYSIREFAKGAFFCTLSLRAIYGKFLKRWEYQTTLPISWETCVQVKKQQLDPDKEQLTGSKLGRSRTNLRYANSTTPMAESDKELGSLLMKVKEENEKAGLKLHTQKTKIMASGPITSWQVDGETMETAIDFILGLQNHCKWWLQPWN